MKSSAPPTKKNALGKTQAIPQKSSYQKTEEEINALIKKM
jgi:hypothetical protein